MTPSLVGTNDPKKISWPGMNAGAIPPLTTAETTQTQSAQAPKPDDTPTQRAQPDDTTRANTRTAQAHSPLADYNRRRALSRYDEAKTSASDLADGKHPDASIEQFQKGSAAHSVQGMLRQLYPECANDKHLNDGKLGPYTMGLVNAQRNKLGIPVTDENRNKVDAATYDALQRATANTRESLKDVPPAKSVQDSTPNAPAGQGLEAHSYDAGFGYGGTPGSDAPTGSQNREPVEPKAWSPEATQDPMRRLDQLSTRYNALSTERKAIEDQLVHPPEQSTHSPRRNLPDKNVLMDRLSQIAQEQNTLRTQLDETGHPVDVDP